MRDSKPEFESAPRPEPEAVVRQAAAAKARPPPLERPIQYTAPGLALLRFAGSCLTMIALAEIYVGLKVLFF